LQECLTALPLSAGEDGVQGATQAFMVIAGDKGDAMQAAFFEAEEKGSPMDFGFADGGADAQDGAFAVGADADGQKDRARADGAVLTDFFIAGIQDEIGCFIERTVAPGVEFPIEFGNGPGDFGPGGLCFPVRQ